MSIQTTESKNKKNRSAIITAIIMLIIFVLSFVYYYNHTIISDIVIYEYNSRSYVYQIEDATIQDDILKISGWCFKLEEDTTESTFSDMRIVLTDSDSYEKKIYYDTLHGVERKDVNDYFDDGFDYTYCGFEVDINLNTSDLLSGNYEVLIQPYERENLSIRTGVYLTKGQLTNINPLISNTLEVENTDLEDIVKEGKLWTYWPEIGLYIYQYDTYLVYIIDNLDADVEQYVLSCNVHTNRTDLLPESRQEVGYESAGFAFKDLEITEYIDAGQYRVAAKELNYLYPITYIDTGIWLEDLGWIWKCRLSPGLR